MTQFPPRFVSGLLPLCLTFLALPVMAGPRTVTITDFTGRGFAPDLVTYAVPKIRDVKLWRVTDGGGNAIPVQCTASPHEKNDTLSFVAAVAPHGSASYTLASDGTGTDPAPASASAFKASREPDATVLANDLLAVRVPLPTDRQFEQPVLASSLPAPILAFRSGVGPWRGSSVLLGDRKVVAWHVALVAAGPVYGELSYELRFAGGGYYRAHIQVIAHVPLVKVREEFDTPGPVQGEAWQLNLTDGWHPNTLEIASTSGNGRVDIGHLAPIRELGATPRPVQSPWVIVGGNAWGTRSQLGLFNAAERAASPDSYALAGFVPLHRGDWRRALGVEIQTDGADQVSLKLPISFRPPSWSVEVTSETSPMSVNEHDPALPATYSRRAWGLVLAPPALHPKVEGENAAAGPCYEARLLYGVVGLDHYKDYILHWPDSGTAYPRVMVHRDELPHFVATVGASPLAAALQGFYFTSKSDEVARRNLVQLRHELDFIAQYMVTSPTIDNHVTWTEAVALADDVLSWPGLSPTDRADLRARLALITYLQFDSDVMGHGEGSHLGNPNMSIGRQTEMCNFMELLPDHPMHALWRDYATRFITYKLGSNMAPGGGWFEFGASYQMHSLLHLNRAMFGLTEPGGTYADDLFGYLQPSWRYYLNLLTPYDSRYHSRMIPGGANSQPGYPADFYEAAGLFANRDPEFASQLQWAWDDNGRPLIGGDIIVTPVVGRPWVKPVAPKLGSTIIPGVGVILRAHQGPDETYMFLRSGYNWSHWYVDDQGSFTLSSRGGVLVPNQPYEYYGRAAGKPPIDDFNLYNTVRFGSAKNSCIFGWPDTNVLDHAFGDSVDYVWSSTGFPSWYIAPGHTAGFGGPRALDPGIAQATGAFAANRQVMFMKGLEARSPNYFVFRDATVGPGQLASWWNLNLLGRKDDVRVEGPPEGPPEGATGARIAANTEFPTKLDVLFPGRTTLPLATEEDDQAAVNGSPGFALWPRYAQDGPVSPNWFRSDGQPASAAAPPNREKHVLLRLPAAPGEGYFWVAYPHQGNEPVPAPQQLAPGAMKIAAPESTDFVFLSPSPMSYQDGDVVFEGCSGAVRVRAGQIVLALTGGTGRVGYKGAIIAGTAPLQRTIALKDLKPGVVKIVAPRYSIAMPAGKPTGATEQLAPGVSRSRTSDTTTYRIDATGPSPVVDGAVSLAGSHGYVQVAPNAVRIVATDRGYCEFSTASVAVRGVGPFDLTFTPQGIAGTLDGDTRTIVVSKPSGILRPMYHVDGLRWYAGFPDDDAPYREAGSPSYSLALGITAGPHHLQVGEWTYPALPPRIPPAAF